jgi:hypothetical protein
LNLTSSSSSSCFILLPHTKLFSFHIPSSVTLWESYSLLSSAVTWTTSRLSLYNFAARNDVLDSDWYELVDWHLTLLQCDTPASRNSKRPAPT